MTRKSKHNNANQPFTHAEMRMHLTHYGTQSVRLGGDSFLPFGYCPLTLNPIAPYSTESSGDADADGRSEGVVSRTSGTLYNREAILSYLVLQTGKITAKREQYAEQVTKEIEQRISSEQNEEEVKIKNFEKSNNAIVQSSYGAHTKQLTDHLKGKGYDLTTKDEKQKELKNVAYWLSSNAPTGIDQVVSEAVTRERPGSPISGKPLAMKDLLDAHLKISPKVSNKGSEAEVYICNVTGEEIGNRECVLLGKSGTVCLKLFYDNVVKKEGVVKKKKDKDSNKRSKGNDGKNASQMVERTEEEGEKKVEEEDIVMIDPVTSMKFKAKDVIVIRKSGTGFTSGGGANVEAKVYRATMT